MTARKLLDELEAMWLRDGRLGDRAPVPTILDILDDLASLDVEGASEMYFLALKASQLTEPLDK